MLWRKYQGKVGFLSDQLEYSAGMVASVIANFAGKISSRDFQASDFMPSMCKVVEKVNQPDLSQKLRLTFAAVNRSFQQRKPK